MKSLGRKQQGGMSSLHRTGARKVKKRNSHAKAVHGIDIFPLSNRDAEFRRSASTAFSTSMNICDEVNFEKCSINVYADLEYNDAAEMQRKTQLAGEITRAI